MGGRYLEELRRIARAQSATPAASGPATEEPGAQPRRGRLLFTVLVIVVLVGAGWWVIRRLSADAKLQDCVMSGRKNCAPLEVDPVGR